MFLGEYNLMGCIKEIPTLKDDNYMEWKKKIDLAFILAEVDWIVTSPCPTKPMVPVRETNEADAAWAPEKGILHPKRCHMTLSIVNGSLPTRNVWLWVQS